MRELVKITEHKGNQAVSARELHDYLEVNSNFTTWCNRMFNYGFEEDLDFIPILEESQGGRPRQDFVLTLDCAKEISMLQRNEKGKEARRYFIEVEKRAKQIVKQLSPAEQLLQNAQLLVAQEKKLTEHDNRLRELEAKTTTKPEYYTIAGYGSLNGISVNIKVASKLGREASRICRNKGLMTDEIPDPRFGKVKMYPKQVLNEVFNSVTL